MTDRASCHWPQCLPDPDGARGDLPPPSQRRECGCHGDPAPICEPQWPAAPPMDDLPDIDLYKEKPRA